jgi:tetratricopeptide (TPR) repeat protein
MNKLAQLPTAGRTRRASGRRFRRAARRHTRYFAFLSYSHKDEALAEWLHSQLEEFRVPRRLAGHLTENGIIPKRLRPIFRDQHELAAADDLGEEIEEALANSQYLIVLCSPAAAKSHWTNAEIETFKRTRPDGCVLAAIAAGEPFASEIEGREAEECFPPALRQKYDRRGRPTGKKAEPLAADLRDSSDGRRIGFLKLVAGMLGVGLDDLVQRETTRRQRRMALLAAASLAGMAVTSTLAVTAIQARDAARDQRRQAEGLVEFMVGDLRNKLEPIGRLDALDGVGSRVLAYYSKQDASDLSDDALVQRSQALNMMAEVAFNRGNLKEAQQLYRQAMAGTAEAVRRSPDDPERIFDHAQNVFYVGETARFAGRPAEAEAAWREYKRLADQMTALAPDNLKYRMELLYANEDVGISLYYQHRFAEADQLFEGAAGPMEKLASLYPANTTYQKEFATLLAWVADAQRSQGNFKAAIDARNRQIASLQQLLSAAADSSARAELIGAHEGLGLALADSGQSDRAIEELQSAVGEAEDLIPIEPRNAQWKGMAADARLALAATLLSIGRRDQAAQQASTGCTLTDALPATYDARSRLATMCAMIRTRLALSAGATQQAMSFAERALASARSQHSEDPITDRYRIATMQRLIGDVRKRGGDSEGASAAWNAALAELPQNVAERPREMSERAELLRRMARAQEAAAIAARLDAMGYRLPADARS